MSSTCTYKVSGKLEDKIEFEFASHAEFDIRVYQDVPPFKPMNQGPNRSEFNKSIRLEAEKATVKTEWMRVDVDIERNLLAVVARSCPK